MYNAITFSGQILTAVGTDFLTACNIAKEYYNKTSEHCDVVRIHYEWNTEMLSEDKTGEKVKTIAA